MLLSEICIKRPVFCTVLSLLIITLGTIYFNKLELRGSPNVTPPVITVSSYYAGANAEYMESNVTNNLEKELKSINHLDYMTSSSSSASSSIALIFDLDTDLNQALSDVRSKISEASNLLPDDMILPKASKVDFASQPSFWIAINSSKFNDMELTDLIKTQILPDIERLPSVGAVKTHGTREFSIRIEPDPLKLYERNLLPTAIAQAVQSQTQDYPAGIIKTAAQNFSLKLNNTPTTPEDYAILTVAQINNQSINIGDIAHVYTAPYDENVILKYNGKQAIAVGAIKNSKANTLDVSDEIYALLPSLKAAMPDHVTIDVAYDASVSVRASIHTVYRTIAEAILFVSIIIFLFLGKARITVIPLLTIPISLIGTFAVMHFLGFSINMFSLLAMVLAIGLVVDDAIVMLENVYRHCENGMKPMDAAFKAVNEIGFAIVAMTITLAAVFLPIGMLEGMVGKLFIEFAWTLAICVLVSGFVALTLTPMLCSRLITTNSENIKLPNIVVKFGQYIDTLQKLYLRTLDWVFHNIKYFAVLCLASVGVLVLAFTYTDKTFTPEEDEGILFIHGRGPEGSTLEDTAESTYKLEQILSPNPDIYGYFSISGFGGSNSMGAFVPLNDWSLRDKSNAQIKDELQMQTNKIPAMSVYVSVPGSQLGNGGSPIEFHLITRDSFKALDTISQEFVNRMKQEGIFTNPERDLHTTIPALDIKINQDKATLYGLSMDEIGRSIQYIIGGKKIGTFQKGNEIYNVTLTYGDTEKNKVESLQNIYLPSATGNLINLTTIADISETLSVDAYSHYNNILSVKLTSGLTTGYTLASASEKITEIQKELLDPALYSIEIEGELKQMRDSNASMLMTFLFALIIIYLVLSAQFESFIDPILILLAVPFSMTGGVLSLWLFGNSINLYSNIGLITLVGLVTKNSIMIVEFANQLRESGMKGLDAVLEAAKLRFRPILMTTIATIAGASPLVMTSGAGAAASTSIGIVIIGGTAIGTLFTMFVIPVIYSKRYNT